MTSRTLLITGASRGIGKSLAYGLADDFQQMVIHYGHDSVPAEQLCEKLIKQGVDAVAIQADIGDEQAVMALFEEAQSQFGSIDAVVQNAGVNSKGQIPVIELSLEEYERLHRTNNRGAFLVLREAARRISDHGRIIAMTTTINRIHSPGYAAYATSKGIIDHLVPILAKELASRGISVNGVAPSAVDTQLFRDGKSDQQITAIAKAQPMERIGLPEDIVPIVRFLASPESGWISGQIIGANGGLA